MSNPKVKITIAMRPTFRRFWMLPLWKKKSITLDLEEGTILLNKIGEALKEYKKTIKGE
jgi:hypothetical protein